MSTLAAATVLDEDRWDDRVLEVMLANFRTTGRLGFRATANRTGKNGWQYYYQRPTLNLASHPTAQLLAANLMAYEASGYRPLLDRTKTYQAPIERPERWIHARLVVPSVV